MTNRRYPSMRNDTIEEIAKWVHEVTRTREEDIGNADVMRLKIDQLPQCIMIPCGDETTAITAGAAKVTFRMPFDFTLTGVKASVTTAATGATLLAIDVNVAAASIFSTVITLDAGEKTSVTAATPPVLTTFDLAADTSMTIDFDAVGNTIAGAGVKVYLIGYAT